MRIQKVQTMRLHKSRVRKNAFGGVTTTTECGRTNAASDNGMNIATSDNEVTCKFCLKLMRIGRQLRESRKT